MITGKKTRDDIKAVAVFLDRYCAKRGFDAAWRMRKAAILAKHGIVQ